MKKRISPSWTKVSYFALLALLPGALQRGATAQESASPRQFKLNGPDASFLLAKDYPRAGLHLDFSLRYEKPGVVLDTVGINGAPVGAWSVSINGEGKLTAQVFDNGWHLLTSTQKLAAGQMYRVVLDFTGENMVMRVGDAPQQQLALPTPLSGQPVWVGDFPGDDRWGTRFNIHPAFTGTLTVHRFGPEDSGAPATPGISTPGTPATGVADNKSEIVDETGTLTRDDILTLLLLLRGLELEHRVQLALVIAAPAEDAALKAHADQLRQSLVARGVLPDKRSGLFVMAGDGLRYHRDTELDAIMPGETVRAAWLSVRSNTSAASKAQGFLEGLGAALKKPGALPPDTSTPPTSTPPVAPVKLNLPTPGAVLTEARIGPEGGQIKAGTTFQVDIPAGALTRTETIKVRAADKAFGGGALYFVEREGQGTFNQPVRVSFTLPPGVTAEQVSAVHQLSPQAWQIVPSSFDTATRRLTMPVRHFSLVGWLMNISMRTWVKLTGAGVGTTGGVILVLVFGGISATAPVSVPATAFLVACGTGGWFAAEPLYDAIGQRGLVGPMRAVSFDIFWEPEALAAAPRFYGVIGNDGKLQELSSENMQAIDGRLVNVPRPIFELAGQLQGIKEWYRVNGYTPPDTIPVLVHSKLGKSKEPGKAVNAGEWDGKSLSVNINALVQEDEQQKLLATLSHEYWHAIFTHNGYKESFVGADDCLATTFESMIFPGSDDFINLHPGVEFGRVIASGLPGPSGDEGYTSPEMRGYALWPWGQFIFNSQGHEGLRAIAAGSFRPDTLSSLFVNFTRAIVTTDHALPDPDKIQQPDGNDEEFRTGWKHVSYGALGIKQEPLTPPARLDWSRTRPLSLKRLIVEMPKREASQPAARLVVRRREPDPQEQIVLLKPARAGMTVLDIARSLDDLVIGTTGALTPADWTDDAAATIFQPVMLVGKSAAPLPPMLGNYLLAYKLAAPTSITAGPLPATATEPARTKIAWTMAEPGKNLKTHDCFAGYRLLGKTKKGEIELIAELLYGPAVTRLNPPQWYRGGDAKIVALDAGQYSVELPAAQTAAYETLGLQTIDGMCREGGNPALSPIAWPQDVDILTALRRTNTFYMKFKGVQTFAVTNTYKNETQNTVFSYPWVVAGGYYPNQKLLWNDRNFSFSWTGRQTSSTDVFESPSAHGASDAEWAITLQGSVDGNGNLISATGKVTRTGQGYWDKGFVDTATFTLHDLQISGKIIEPNRITVNYTSSGPAAARHIRAMSAGRTLTGQSWNYAATDWSRPDNETQVSLSFTLR